MSPMYLNTTIMKRFCLMVKKITFAQISETACQLQLLAIRSHKLMFFHLKLQYTTNLIVSLKWLDLAGSSICLDKSRLIVQVFLAQ